MRTVISHFYNEEYLLPWWLKHHVDMFDYGILIDYGSTDRSVEICRSIAPHWRVVRSRNFEFEAIMVDFEVMQYESELPGWKIALNTTEFLCGANLPPLETLITQKDLLGCYFECAVMVDCDPESEPTHDRPLVQQKHHGFLEDTRKGTHGRLYHRASIGAYHPGRHLSYQPCLAKGEGCGTVMWYKMAPWTRTFLDRKLQIQRRIPARDRVGGLGAHHFVDIGQLEQDRQAALARTIDLGHLTTC